MCAWVRIPLLSNFAFKKPTFWSKQVFWESNEKQDKRIPHYKKVVIEDRMKQVRYTQGRMAERSTAPDSRNSPLRLLVHECVRGFESHSCQNLRSKRQHFNRSSIESHSCQILRSKSQHFGQSSISESQIKSKTEQISHYKKVLSKTGWSKCDILKAGWPSGVRRQTQEILLWDFWYTNVCLGSNPTTVKFCVQKANILVEAGVLRVKWGARQTDSALQEGCYRRQDEAIAVYSRQDGRAVWGARLKKFSFETSGTRMCAWVRIPLLSNFAFKKPTFWSKQVFWESNEKQDKRIPHYKKVVIEDRMKQVRYTQGRMAERSTAPDSRNSPLRLLIHECVRGFESHSCQNLRSKRQHFNRSSIESHSCQILRSKSQHFGQSSISESQIKSKTEQISHYKKVLSKTGWSKCDILKAGWPSGVRRQTQEILLWDFWYTNVCLGSNPTTVKFCVQKANILAEAGVLRVKWEARQTDSTLQEGVIEDRMKQVRYTQGRIAEQSTAPDSRNSPLRLLVHECGRGFESHSCQILRSKKQHFNRSSIESHSCQILRSKSQHFGQSSISESQIKSKTEQISHYKKVLSKTGWSKCDILKAGWPSDVRRQTQEILHWDFWYTNVCLGSNPTPVKFCVQKAKYLVEAGVLRVKWEARQTDSTLQEGVIEDRMKQVRYTQGRIAEQSTAPDSRNSPLRLLIHECVRGFQSHSCQILRSKWQHFNRRSIESHSCQILRSKSQHFGRSSISDSQIKSKTEHISHYKKVLSKTGWSKCDILKAGWPSGLRRQTQEILLWGFWYTNVCLGSNPTPVKFCVQKANILIEAGVLRVKWEARQTDSTLQVGVIEDRMKQVRYNQGRMAERSKAPDSRNSPDFWYTNVCVGSNPTPVKFCVQKGKILIEAVSNPTHVKFCVQKANILVQAVFLRVKSRGRRSRFLITRRCYRRQDEASAIYSRQDGRAV